MVEICFVDGTSETIEATFSEAYRSYFVYDTKLKMFIVFRTKEPVQNVYYPREFVKSIKYIED